MSHALHISDAAYQVLQAMAAQRGESPEAVVERLITSAAPGDGPYYETEDWFRHLGMTEEEIRQGQEQAEREDANP
jgi:hypothetical protein